MSWGEALLWGAVIVSVVLGVLAATYFLSNISFLPRCNDALPPPNRRRITGRPACARNPNRGH